MQQNIRKLYCYRFISEIYTVGHGICMVTSGVAPRLAKVVQVDRTSQPRGIFKALIFEVDYQNITRSHYNFVKNGVEINLKTKIADKLQQCTVKRIQMIKITVKC